ncbi:hypothetical protein M404DRAFT_938123 [Pisolithus tinctorius Marx 270]|uniref:Protein RRP5 homolog n=1 Tax=Pisolithus tinctorius Marx 270 TaxID=870435 RepID=A0A0C3PJT1_PISTI|nr:hypothetical protein M404DRAFT_938123 [Pisolithus tinctorius Marx 270]
MTGKKRALEDGTSSRKAKKAKGSSGKSHEKYPGEDSFPVDSTVMAEEVDFPRGGGTNLTALEEKEIRAEAIKEVDKGLLSKPKVNRKKSKSQLELKPEGSKKEGLRIEHLNYKRMVPGMKILGQVVSVQPLALVVSLPNQLVAHVPITKITSQLSRLLESMDVRSDASGESDDDVVADNVPDLSELFHPGQYVRCVVTNAHPPGTTDLTGLARSRDEVVRASRRVELSLVPEEVNAGVRKSDLKDGYTMSAAVQSIEDHGYILDLGISGVSGFLSFRDAHKEGSDERFRIGCLIDIVVLRLSANGRTCNVTTDSKTLAATSVSEVSDVTSVLPGMLVQSLVTAVTANGLGLQILGFFDATADEYHQSRTQKTPKVGQRVKARILYNIPGTSPPRFSVTLSDHHLALGVKSAAVDLDGYSLVDAFPIGTTLDSVKVRHVEPEQGLLVEVQPTVDGFVHISQVSDEHTPTLSGTSSHWKIATLHKARVIGHHMFDGILQLSLRPSVFLQKFLQVGDIRVGEVIKGTVKSLTDSAVFVSISERLDGVIWPNHYADVPLKYPAKKFKVGASIKCRVLTVEPERNRVILTTKRTLLDTTQPILTSYEDAKIGAVTHGVIFAVSEKGLKVEFFNNVKATIPTREASETGAKLTDAFTPGKVTKVRIIAVRKDTRRIVASIRQATSAFSPAVTDVSSLSVGDTVQGAVVELQKANIILSLQPSEARAHLSFVTLANIRGTTVPELRTSLKPGTIIDSLVVTSVEEGFVVVGGKPGSLTKPKTSLSMDTVAIGQIVRGRVTGHGRSGTTVKLSARITGSFHPTDACDDYEVGNPFPAVGSVLQAVVIGIDESASHLTLSTRPSKISPDSANPPVDRELSCFEDLKMGDTIRGFIKSVSEHGLFVTIGRGIDARVQIRELFDEYIKDWKSRFVTNQLVKGRILSVDVDNKKVEMTFKSGDLARNQSKMITFNDLQEGQKVMGKVKRIEQYGLFIVIDGSKVTGLCHKSQLSDNKDADVTIALRTFREGDRVRAIILSLDSEKKQLSLGLKPSYFAGDEDIEVKDDQSLKGDGSSASEAEIEEENDPSHMSDQSTEENLEEATEDDGGDDQRGISIENQPEEPSVLSQKRQVPLKLEGFQWFSGDVISEDSGPGSCSEDETESRKKKRRRRKRKEIQQDLTADMHTKVPESSADFERLLLGSPNSSYLWIQYMSFYLQMSEIDKARAIGRRAVQTINFREEQERLNVWIALLNIENTYGSDTTMEAVFKDAARHNDSKTVHLRLAVIFEDSQRYEKAEEQYKRTCKKFGQSSKVWTLFAEHYLRRGQLEEARKLLPRSLQSLDKQKHIKTISKFAQMEYKLGDPERGRTIFEGIVDSHPKRWDLWSIYMDMEAKQEDIQHLRNIFGRVLAIKMTSHKAKSFFKKWLNLEHKIGDDEGAATVKQRAIEWTQRAAAAS